MKGMITVRRANVILDIREDEKAAYVNNGYSVIDSVTGAVIEESMPNDVKTLQVEVAALKKENAELKAKLAVKEEPMLPKQPKVNKIKTKN